MLQGMLQGIIALPCDPMRDVIQPCHESVFHLPDFHGVQSSSWVFFFRAARSSFSPESVLIQWEVNASASKELGRLYALDYQ